MALACLALAGCQESVTTSTSPSASHSPRLPTGEAEQHAAEITLSRHGGLCPEGACGFEVAVSALDGTWTATGTGVSPAPGKADPEAVAQLGELIAAHFDELTAAPFEDDCPTAYDGQEFTITVLLIPTGPDAHLRDAQLLQTSSCTHAWPEEPIMQIARVWEDVGLPPVFAIDG